MTPSFTAEDDRISAMLVRRMEQLRQDREDGAISEWEFRREYGPLERELDALIKAREAARIDGR